MRLRSVLSLASLSLAALAAVAAPAAAHAQGYYPPPPPRYHTGPRETGLYVGGKIGLGFPTGDLSGDVGAMSDTVGVKVPFGFEFGARLNRTLRIGIFGDLAPAGVKDAVCATGSCSAMDSRIGADLQVHLAPFTQTDPWLGAGLAYEWLSDNGIGVTDPTTGQTYVVDETWSGGQLVLEGGIDFPVAPAFTVGPYLNLEIGRFGSYSATGAGSYSIGSTTTHTWITIGVKGTFLL